MKYTVHGPFEMPKKSNGLIDANSKSLRAFWNDVRKKVPDLPTASGCYLFAVRAAKGYRPCYVGLAEKQSFEKECFTDHKKTVYNDAIAMRKGTPVLFLIARRTGNGRLASPRKGAKKMPKEISVLEDMLIAVCVGKNPELLNVKKTKLLREMVVPGLINTPKGKPTVPEKQFKQAVSK
jgi:hypothetical protein